MSLPAGWVTLRSSHSESRRDHVAAVVKDVLHHRLCYGDKSVARAMPALSPL